MTVAIVVLLGGAATPAMAETPAFERLRYTASIGGLTLGELDLGIARDAAAYRAEAEFRMARWLTWVLDTDARAQAVGRFEADGPRPELFRYFVRDRDERRNTEIRFDPQGNAAEIDADPPFRKKGYDMTLAEAAGALDPATAAVALTTPRTEPCALSLDVFDGRKRHRITLSEARETAPGRVHCRGHYRRIAGFKAKHMTPERRSYDFQAVLERTGDGLWRPRRIWADTDYGTAVVMRRD